MPSHISHRFSCSSWNVLLALPSLWVSLASAICMCVLHAISSMMAQQWFLGNRVQWVGCRRGFLGTSERRSRPKKKQSFSYLLTSQPQRARGGWKRSQSKFQHWKTSWTDPWIFGAWSWWSGQWGTQGSVQVGCPFGAITSDPWSVTVPPRSACWTCCAFWANPATRKCSRRTWTTSPWSIWQQVAARFGRSSVRSSWPWRREKNGGIVVGSRRGSSTGGGTHRGRALYPSNCRFSEPWTLVRAFWWPDWKTRPKRRMARVCKKWLELNWHFVFDLPKKKNPNERVTLL